MKNVFKTFVIVLALMVMRPALSYADWHNHHGYDGPYDHDGYHGRTYVGFNLSLLPDYNYYAPYYYEPTDEVLVSSPVVVEPQEQVVQGNMGVITAAPISDDVQDAITVNIPNSRGGYTAVTLKRSGDGYTGPQGEFYAQFPKVSQLKLMYGN